MTQFIYIEDIEEAAKDFAVDYYPYCGASMADTAMTVCREQGHDLVDCSTAGPDSGNMDHECRRCGQYWSVPLY